MIIKVCGMRDADNIQQVDAIKGIDWMGFIFWSKSKRFVSHQPVQMPQRAKRVGVFVDEDIEHVRHIARQYHLDLIQLHGHESPDYCQQLHGEWKVIKAFNIATTDDLAQTANYEGHADYFLFDTKGKSIGGNGTKFDWDILTAYHGSTPFLLTGGIMPTDAEAVKQ
ncbi:MAG: phosphoribosylanthranilate isomerase, partial [Bacteroidaceae bacterium]|nr:phosphoribosylanthranilate isomerase [Bacteroidaceae bacterium]